MPHKEILRCASGTISRQRWPPGRLAGALLHSSHGLEEFTLCTLGSIKQQGG